MKFIRSERGYLSILVIHSIEWMDAEERADHRGGWTAWVTVNSDPDVRIPAEIDDGTGIEDLGGIDTIPANPGFFALCLCNDWNNQLAVFKNPIVAWKMFRGTPFPIGLIDEFADEGDLLCPDGVVRSFTGENVWNNIDEWESEKRQQLEKGKL
jgi:hypothetical protein